MKEERLFVRPFEDFQVLDYKSIQQINEHARAEVKGRVPYSRKEDYIVAGKGQTWVQVVAESGGEESILFYGVVEQLSIEAKDGACMVVFHLASGTLLMDFEEHIRSFQKENLTYSDLLDTCNQGYEKALKIMTEGKGKSICQFIMQYQETDWDFIKRLAAMNHTVLFADCHTKGERYHFGIPDRKSAKEETVTEYQTQYNIHEYWHKKKQGLKISPEAVVSYIWESRESHKLGEQKLIYGKECFIWRVESCRKGNELYHTSFMKPRSGFLVPVQYNSHISGVSLLGKVIRVRSNKVQIKIISDENKGQTELKWFSFSTVYSSQDGTGWYCMPEIGDTVRLYFPTTMEQESYVSSAYHEEGTKLRQQPENKFWRNKEGKEIQLSPERILLTNNDGTYIELSDEKGIEMVSDGSISVRARGTLSITSDSTIELNAPGDITLKQGETKMNLGGDIAMQGAKIML